MAEDGIPDVLAEQHLGHEVPGMRGLYTYASDQMREALIQALQARWEDSLRARAAIRPHSPVLLLNELLTSRRRPRADTGSVNGIVRYPAIWTTHWRQGEVDLPNSSQTVRRPIPGRRMRPVPELLTWAYTWWAILGSNQ